MRIYSQEVAQLLLELFTEGVVDGDCIAKSCGTFYNIGSPLADPKYQPGSVIIMAACVCPSMEAGLPEAADTMLQRYDVPVFACAKIPQVSASKPWEAQQALVNMLLNRLDPWTRAQDRKDSPRPNIAEGVTVNGAMIASNGFDSLAEDLLAQGWYTVDVTVRIELGVPR
jgi:hypothetical protein